MNKNIIKKKGFTLIEILITVIIVGLLAGVAVIKLGQHYEKAQENYLKSAIVMMERGIDQVILINGSFPDIVSDVPESRVAEILNVLKGNDIFVQLEKEFKLNPDQVFASAFPEAYALAQVEGQSAESIIETNKKVRNGLPSGTPEAKEILVLPRVGPIVYPERIELILNDPLNPDFTYYSDYWTQKAVEEAWQYYKDNGYFENEDAFNLVMGNIKYTDMDGEALSGFLEGMNPSEKANVLNQLMDGYGNGLLGVTDEDIVVILHENLNGPDSAFVINSINLGKVPWEAVDAVTKENIVAQRANDIDDSMVSRMIQGMGNGMDDFILLDRLSLSGKLKDEHNDYLAGVIDLTEYRLNKFTFTQPHFLNGLNGEQKGKLLENLMNNGKVEDLINMAGLTDIGGYAFFKGLKLSNVNEDALNYISDNFDSLSITTKAMLANMLSGMTDKEMDSNLISSFFNDLNANRSRIGLANDFVSKYINNENVPGDIKSAFANLALNGLGSNSSFSNHAPFVTGYDYGSDDAMFQAHMTRLLANQTRSGAAEGMAALLKNPNLTEDQLNQIKAQLSTNGVGLAIYRDFPFSDEDINNIIATGNPEYLFYNPNLSADSRMEVMNEIIKDPTKFRALDRRRDGISVLDYATDNELLELYGGGFTLDSVDRNKFLERADNLTKQALGERILGLDSLNAEQYSTLNSLLAGGYISNERDVYDAMSRTDGYINTGEMDKLTTALLNSKDSAFVNDIKQDLIDNGKIDVLLNYLNKSGNHSEITNELLNKYYEDKGSNSLLNNVFLENVSDPDIINSLLGNYNSNQFILKNKHLTEDQLNSLYNNWDSMSGGDKARFVENENLTSNIAAAIIPGALFDSNQGYNILSRPEFANEVLEALNSSTEPLPSFALGEILTNKGISENDKRVLFNAYKGTVDDTIMTMLNPNMKEFFSSSPNILDETILDIVDYLRVKAPNMSMPSYYRTELIKLYGDVLTHDQKLLIYGE